MSRLSIRFDYLATPLRISVRDHIIVGKNGYASLKGLKLV
jgi:DNA repair protein RadC